jgi:hypothetical protein
MQGLHFLVRTALSILPNRRSFFRGTIIAGPEKPSANPRCETSQTRSIAVFLRGADDRDHLETTARGHFLISLQSKEIGQV